MVAREQMSAVTHRAPVRSTFLGVQAVRGFAAMMVVIYHASQMWSQHAGDGKTASGWGNGAAGVDLFFIVSGFVMAVSTIGREHKVHPARSFLERRLIRVVPLYWIMTLTVLLKQIVVIYHPAVQNSTLHPRLSAGYILSSLLFIPYRDSLGTTQPLLYVGWTLSFEMFFYLLFAVALALRIRVLRLLTPVMIALVILGKLVQFNWAPFAVITSPMLLEFLAGVVLGIMVLKGVRVSSRISLPLGLIAMGFLLFGRWSDIHDTEYLVWGFPALLMVQAVVMSEERFGHLWPRWALAVGDASYSLYLVHPLVNLFAYKLLIRIHVLSNGTVRIRDEFATVAVCLLLSISAALLIYRLVERPLTERLRRGWLREPKSAAQAVVLSGSDLQTSMQPE